MAHDVQVLESLRNADVDADLADAALLRIYDGAKPANPGVALGGSNHQLSEHAVTPGAASGGASTIVVADDTDADATGTASWAALCLANGTRIVDMTVGVGSGFDINVGTTDIRQHGLVEIDSFVYSRP